MENEIWLGKLRWFCNAYRGTKPAQRFVEANCLIRGNLYEEVQVFGVAWLTMKANRNATNDQYLIPAASSAANSSIQSLSPDPRMQHLVIKFS